jgi:hypothetical protein
MLSLYMVVEQWNLPRSFWGRFWTYIAPPLFCSHAGFLAVVWVCFGLVLECFLEGLCYVVVTEASEPERSGDFAVLLGHWFSGSEEGAKGIKTDEQVLFGHDFDGYLER